MKDKEHISERRRYVRLETVFPVEFQIYLKDTGQSISNLKQGFTRDVSEGGMCLEINELENGFCSDMKSEKNRLKLFINMPHHKDPIASMAEVRWSKKVKEGFPNKYLFGVEYADIDDRVRKKIIGYAKGMRRRHKVIVSAILLLVLSCGVLAWQVHNIYVKKGITEEQLLHIGNALTKAYEERIELENKIYTLNIKRQKLGKFLKGSMGKVDLLEERLSQMSALGNQLSDELIKQKLNLANELMVWRTERENLLKQYKELSNAKQLLNEELLKLKESSSARIVRAWLTNGSSIIGELIDITSDKVIIKIGLGHIGIERTMISSIKEVSGSEKINIKNEWEKQEEEARKAEEKYKKYLSSQHKKGLVYYNGKWLSKEEAEKEKERLRKREEEVFELIANQRAKGVSDKKGQGLVETLFEKELKPVISIKDKRIYINGRLFFIKGIDYGIEYPGTSGGISTFKTAPPGIFEKDFKMMKDAGINTIRTYEPLPEKLLDLAEKHGIMVIENICYPSDNTDFNSRVHLDILKEQIKKYVLRDKERRCVLMWSIWNDAPWAWGSAGNPVQKYGFAKVNNFLKELYNTVRKYDISHPVTASNAIDIEGEKLGWDFLDVVGLNLYLGGYDWFNEEEAKRNIAEVKSIEEEYNKPVVILETGFSTFIQGQKQEEILEKQIKTAGTNVAGISIFQWADGWNKAGDKDRQNDHIEEHWGILDGYRKPKPGYNVVCKIFRNIPTESYGYEEE